MIKKYGETLKKMHFDMHTTSSVKDVGKYLDAEAFADAIEASGAESVTWFARSGYAFYPTEFGDFHPNAERDIFKEVSEALRKRNIDITGYYALSRLSQKEADDHNAPEWIATDEDGTKSSFPGSFDSSGDVMYRPCVSSGFLQNEIIPFVVETVKRYQINGAWIDGVYQYLNNPCYCDNCRAKFLEAYPEAKGNVHSRAYYKWIQEQIWDFFNQLAEAVEEVQPGTTVGGDVIGTMMWSIPYPEKVGFVTYDPQTPNLAFNNAMHLSSQCWRGIPTDMNIQKMESWSNPTARSLNTLLTETAVSMSMNSLFVVGDVIDANTILPDIENMKLFKKVFDYGESIYNKIKHGKAFADIAIISSPEQMRRKFGDWHLPYSHIEGAYQTVLEAGLTAHILFDDDLEKNLARYPVAIIPEQMYMGTHACKAVEKYVANGGKLIVTGCLPKSIDSISTNDKADPTFFERLSGLKRKCILDDELCYMSVKESPVEKLWSDDLKPDIRIKTLTELVELNGAEELSPLYYAGPLKQVRLKGDKTGTPAITKYQYGEGTVIFVAPSVFEEIKLDGNYWAKYLMQCIIDSEIKPYARIDGYSNAQLVVAKEEDKTYLSTIIYDNDLRELAPRVSVKPPLVAGLTITVNDSRDISYASSVMGGSFHYEKKGDVLTIELDPVRTYEGIIINWK